MKKLVFLLIMTFILSGCLPDFEFLYAGEVLDLAECVQHDYPAPRNETFRTTYIVNDTDGNPVAGADVFRELNQTICNGGIAGVTYGLVTTDANGQFSETDELIFGNAKEKANVVAQLQGKPGAYESSAKVKKYASQSGSITFVFTVDLLED